MGLLFKLTLFLFTLTLIAAAPVQFISVVQTPYPGSATYTYDGRTGDCINVQYTNIATELRLIKPAYNRESLRINFFSTSCFDYQRNYIGNETLSQSGVLIINRRKPSCSFKLETSESRPVGVTFYYGTDGRKTESLSNKGDCINRCSSTETSLNYPHSVYFTRNGSPVQINNGIHLFSDKGCTNNITHEPVFLVPEQPNNLVRVTSEAEVQVKSFSIENID